MSVDIIFLIFCFCFWDTVLLTLASLGQSIISLDLQNAQMSNMHHHTILEILFKEIYKPHHILLASLLYSPTLTYTSIGFKVSFPLRAQASQGWYNVTMNLLTRAFPQETFLSKVVNVPWYDMQ